MNKLLSSLASGDNVSKLLMVLILIVQGGGILNVDRDGARTREAFFKAQALAQKQIKYLYRNQSTWVVVVKGIKNDDDALLNHFGLPPSKVPDVTPLPPLDDPEDDK